MDNQEMVYKLLEVLTDLKKTKFRYIHPKDELSNNERLVLFIIHNQSKQDRISLSVIREKMKLAPSTITPIISSLEKRGLIKRKIDEEDRRNIYIYLSKTGKEFTKRVDRELNDMLYEYIDYMGKKDTEEVIKLIIKTKEFMELKKGAKKC